MKNLFLIPLFVLYSFFSRSQSDVSSDPGMFYTAEFCFGAGVGNVQIDNSVLDANYERTYGLKFLSAYEFSSGLAVGATAIYDYYSDSGFLLLGPDVRYFTSAADFSPFVSANFGYAISIGNENRVGGFYYYPSAGVKIDIDREVDLLLSLGYKRQRFTENFDITLTENGQERIVNKSGDYDLGFLTISVGVLF